MCVVRKFGYFRDCPNQLICGFRPQYIRHQPHDQLLNKNRPVQQNLDGKYHNTTSYCKTATFIK